MKNLKSIFFLFSLTFLFFTYSCSKENSNSPFDLEEGTATVEIGEDLFFSDDVRARFITTHLFAIYMHTNSNGALNESIRIEFYIPDELALENQT